MAPRAQCPGPLGLARVLPRRPRPRARLQRQCPALAARRRPGGTRWNASQGSAGPPQCRRQHALRQERRTSMNSRRGSLILLTLPPPGRPERARTVYANLQFSGDSHENTSEPRSTLSLCTEPLCAEITPGGTQTRPRPPPRPRIKTRVTRDGMRLQYCCVPPRERPDSAPVYRPRVIS